MRRRLSFYMSVAAPALAAVTVVGTGVSFADVGHVAPGPRPVASAAPSGTTGDAGTHPAAAPHKTKPVAHLTCHETDKPQAPSGGPAPVTSSAKPATAPAHPATPPAKPDTGTKPATNPAKPHNDAKPAAKPDTDSVTCHWSHVHLHHHLKAGSLELMRGGTGTGAAAPSAVKTFDAKTKSFTDTSVTDGASYTYVLDVLGADGSLLGTSNKVTVKDHDKDDQTPASAAGPSSTAGPDTHAPKTTTAPQGIPAPQGGKPGHTGDHSTAPGAKPQHPADHHQSRPASADHAANAGAHGGSQGHSGAAAPAPDNQRGS